MTEATQAEWIERARTLTKAGLERAVAEASPEVARREVVRAVRGNRFEMLVNVDADAMAQLRRAQDLVSQSTQQVASLEVTIGVITEFYLEKKDPVRRAERMAGRPNAAAKNAVLLRDRGLCQMIKDSGEACRSSRFTNIHHRVPWALGGSDEPGNLITLCAPCHRLWHRRHGLEVALD